MARIVITGANGFIGRHVVHELVKRNIDFLAVDTKTDTLPSTIHKLDCDIFKESNLYEKFGQPEMILHLAWRDGFIHKSKNHMGDLSCHFQFLTSMIDQGVKHLSVLGSMHEVGYFEGAIDEHTPTQPMSQYGIAKNALREALALYCQETEVCLQWIRAFYIYSNDRKGCSIFSKILQASDRGEKTFPFTTGKNKFDFIKVEDLAYQIVSVISQTEIDGIINCCSGKAVSLGEQVENFIKENHLDIQLQYGVFPDREYDSPMIYGDDTKIRKILGE